MSLSILLDLAQEESRIEKILSIQFDVILFLFPTEYTLSIFLKIREKKIINNAEARLSIDRDYWKHTIYLGNKKDVAKLQLTIGTKGSLKKVVLTEEL